MYTLGIRESTQQHKRSSARDASLAVVCIIYGSLDPSLDLATRASDCEVVHAQCSTIIIITLCMLLRTLPNTLVVASGTT